MSWTLCLCTAWYPLCFGLTCNSWNVVVSADTVIKARSLWEKNGAVVMAVRRPGWFLCREVMAEISNFREEAFLPNLKFWLHFSLSVGGLWAVLSEIPAWRARCSSGRCDQGEYRARGRAVSTFLRWGHLCRWKGEEWAMTSHCFEKLFLTEWDKIYVKQVCGICSQPPCWGEGKV